MFEQPAVAVEGGRLQRARELLRTAENRTTNRPEQAVGERLLPVAAPLARLLPGGGLRRGTAVALLAEPGRPEPGRRGASAQAPASRVRRTAPPGDRPASAGGRRGPARSSGSRPESRVRSTRQRGATGVTSLLWALVAEASAGGAWVGVVGRPELGAVAAAEAGVLLERLALVPEVAGDLLAVTSALLDGLDVVVVAGLERAGLGPADRERLAARARQRGAVLLALGPWPGADLSLTCTAARWSGLAVRGSGRLRERQVLVRSQGRGIAPAGREARLLLPAVQDGVRAAGPITTAEERTPIAAEAGEQAATRWGDGDLMGEAGVAWPAARVAG